MNEPGKKVGLAAAVQICAAEQREIAIEADAEDLFGQVAAPAVIGRPPGARNKETEVQAALIRATGQSPLAFLAGIWRDVKKPTKERIQAAGLALPYVHKKQPVAIDMGGAAVTLIITGIDDDAGEDHGDDGMVIEGTLVEDENAT